MVLQKGTILQDRYKIRHVLGDAGPIDITYQAQDQSADLDVVVREYFPADMVVRGEDGIEAEIIDVDSYAYEERD